MRLLICSINFSPELTSTGKYTGETAYWLAENGVEVRVVTAPPYYPAWKVGEGYSGKRYATEYPVKNLTVFRCPLWVPHVPTGLKRIVHLLSFAVSSLPVLLRQIRWRPDVVMVVEPPLFSAPGALLLAKLCSARSWLHVQDYEVDAAFNLGMLKGHFLRRIFYGLERGLMHYFDTVSSITPAMMRRAELKGIERSCLVYFPNWVNLDQIKPMLRSSQEVQRFLEELDIPSDAFVGLYAGNIGNKQGIEVVAEAAKRLVDLKNIFFIFCGSGSGLAELKESCSGLSNVRFIDIQPIERFNTLLSMASVHLLPQKSDVADLVMPSKLTGMMASGRPIVATAAADTSVAEAVKGCGIVVPPGDVEQFCAAILTLESNLPLCENAGTNARQWAENNLDQKKILNSLLRELRRDSIHFGPHAD